MPGFDTLVPNDLPAGLTAVLDRPGAYAQDKEPDGRIPAPGTVQDDLEGLTGCWGAVIQDVAEGGEALKIDVYEYLSFDGATGAFEWWTFQDLGGLFPVVSVQTGSFQASAPGRLLLTISSMRTYDPLQGEYRTIGSQDAQMEFLATLNDTELVLLMLDNPGDTAPTGSDNYATIYYKMNCE